MQRESRDANVRKIEYMIRHERQIAEAVTEAKLAPRGHTGGAPSGHSFVSDPTAAQAIRNADEVSLVEIDGGGRVEWPERWLKVVGAVRNWCNNDIFKAAIFTRRYEQNENSHATCAAVNIEINTYYYFLREIRNYAAQCAAQCQVIRVF